MISDLFRTKGSITGAQLNFLKVMSKLPKIKSSMGESATSEDINISNEAQIILLSKKVILPV